MLLDFTVLAYTVLAVYILMGVIAAGVAFLVIIRIARSLNKTTGFFLYPKEVSRRVLANGKMSLFPNSA